MVSFDVVALFTRVPITDSCNLLRALFSEDMVDLFQHVLTFTYFIFHRQFYEQTEGVAMGSLLFNRRLLNWPPVNQNVGTGTWMIYLLSGLMA